MKGAMRSDGTLRSLSIDQYDAKDGDFGTSAGSNEHQAHSENLHLRQNGRLNLAFAVNTLQFKYK